MKTLPYGTIQAIKKNNLLSQQLTELEKILDQIYDRYTERNSQTYRKCIYPVNDEFEQMEPDEFYEMIYKFIEKSELKLMQDSKELILKFQS